jgi:hypothetical protein
VRQRTRFALALAITLLAVHGATARAQYGYYPRGYGGAGWGGWGGGAQTPGSSMARGMGVYAAGAGMYNEQTAQARSINADTTMRFNEYMYQSSQVAKKKHGEMLQRDHQLNIEEYNKINDRIRNNPDKHDIETGDALNTAVEEIENPRVYSRNLARATTKIGGEMIRNIPFRYAPGCITVSIGDLTEGGPPQALMTEDFADDRAAFKSVGQELRKTLDNGDAPNPATVKKALAMINAVEAKADKILPANTRERTEADRYLKALHGLIAMLQTPSLEFLLAGVEKHPEATLGDLLGFMTAHNLRFGEAKTPEQVTLYLTLYPMLDDLRDQVGPALAGAPPSNPQSSSVGEFFNGMDYNDLQKKAPHPGNVPR